MKQFIATTLMVLLSANVFAAEGWGVQTRITGYYVWEDGDAYIKTENNQNLEGCQSSYYLALDPAKLNFKSIWAQIIAAHTADQTVSLYYKGCRGPYAKVTAVAVPNSW